jgi:hypothetical protein
MLVQSGYRYRFHSKKNIDYILTIEKYLDGSQRAVVQAAKDADKDLSVFVATEVVPAKPGDKVEPGIFNLSLPSSSTARTYLTFPINYDEMNRPSFADGDQLICTTTSAYPDVATWRQARFKFDYIDWTWPQHTNTVELDEHGRMKNVLNDWRTPDDTGWVRISCEWDTNHVVDLAAGDAKDKQAVNSWRFDGDAKQQWWPERVG